MTKATNQKKPTKQIFLSIWMVDRKKGRRYSLMTAIEPDSEKAIDLFNYLEKGLEDIRVETLEKYTRSLMIEPIDEFKPVPEDQLLDINIAIQTSTTDGRTCVLSVSQDDPKKALLFIENFDKRLKSTDSMFDLFESIVKEHPDAKNLYWSIERNSV